MTLSRAEKLAYYLALALVIHMPLHILLSQSLSLVTGGLEVWKAAKDVIFCITVPFLLLLAYKQGALKDRFFKKFIILGGLYVLLYVLFLLFDKNTDTKSAIIGSVYNTRPLGYLLLGYVVANSQDGKRRTKTLLKVLLIMCMVVAGFGVVQYFLPKDLLTHVGYSLERGVKPMFFIDDKPDFPRVMSTLRDPNSLGAFLAFPIVYSAYFLLGLDQRRYRTAPELSKKRRNIFSTVNVSTDMPPAEKKISASFLNSPRHSTILRRSNPKKGEQAYKVLSDRWLQVLFGLSLTCLIFTFSRSGVIAVTVSIVTLLYIATEHKTQIIKKYAPILVAGLVLVTSLLLVYKNSYVVQNLLLHADKSTVEVDPNQLRLNLYQSSVEHISNYPFGDGPGSAGIVSLGRTRPAVLTENYYLQIAYEVGVLGLILFVTISSLVLVVLYKNKNNQLVIIVFFVGIGIAVFGLLNHSWTNEALALQWWILAGAANAAK